MISMNSDKLLMPYSSSKILFFPLLFLVFFSCSTMKLEKYEIYQNTNYIESSNAQGLFLFAKPMMNKADLKKYFGVDLLKNNILPVYISVWNKNPNISYIIYEESFRILQATSKDKTFQPESEDEKLGEFSEVALYPVYIIPELIVPLAPIASFSSQQYSDAEIIKDNFEEKKFRTTTLEPYEKKSGFVYFNLKDIKNYNKIDMCFKNIEAITSNYSESCFDVPLQDRSYE